MGFPLLACRINMSLMLRINSTVFIYGYNTKYIHTVLVCITESWKVGREYGVASKDWTTGGSQFSPSTVWFPETGCEFSGLASTLPSQLVPGLQFQSVWNVSGKPEAGWLRMAAHALIPATGRWTGRSQGQDQPALQREFLTAWAMKTCQEVEEGRTIWPCPTR